MKVVDLFGSATLRAIVLSLAVCIGVLLPSPPTHASNPDVVLVIGDAARRISYAQQLRSVGENVEETSSVPAVLDRYKSVWFVGLNPTVSSTEGQRLANYVRGGGAFFLAWDDPYSAPSLAIGLGNTLLIRPLESTAGQGIAPGPYSFNTSVTDYVATHPNHLAQFVPSDASGLASTSTLPQRNTLISNGSSVVGAVWSEQDMTEGRGRVAVIMDGDWIANPGGSELLQNLRDFLHNGMARTMPAELGYAFANKGMASGTEIGFAESIGLNRTDILTEEVAGRVFQDLQDHRDSGVPIDQHLKSLWSRTAGGTCFGLALTGGRFEANLDPLYSSVGFRAASPWTLGDEYRLPAPSSTQLAYTQELLSHLAGAHISQFSHEFLASWRTQKRAQKTQNPADVLHDQLASVMRAGVDRHGSLAGPAGSKLALLTIVQNREGRWAHAVLAYSSRRYADGSVVVDVWDNNHPGEARTLRIDSQGEWAYDGYSGGTSEGAFISAFPLFSPRDLDYSPPDAGGEWDYVATAITSRGSSFTSVDVDPGVSEVIAGTTGDAGQTKIIRSTTESFTVTGSRPDLTVASADAFFQINSTSSEVPVRLDLDAGAISSPRADEIFVQRGTTAVSAKGAESLAVASDGSISATPKPGATAVVTDAAGTVVLTVPSVEPPAAPETPPPSTGPTPTEPEPALGPGPGTTPPAANAPNRMQDPKVVVRGRKVILKWRAPADNGSVITSYRIDLKKGKNRTASGTARKIKIKKLKPGKYKIRIAAANTVGVSPYSSWVKFRIK